MTKAPLSLPTADHVRAKLAYDPETGVFTWRVRVAQRSPAGSRAGPGKPGERLDISFEGSLYAANRLAWVIMTGAWPTGEIAFRNRVKSDLRWVNLVEVTKAQNQGAARRRSDNRSGHKGVAVQTSGRGRKRFCAVIEHEGRAVWIGRFMTADEAAAAYQAKSDELRGHHAEAATCF